jgi:hypothetical protein
MPRSKQLRIEGEVKQITFKLYYHCLTAPNFVKHRNDIYHSIFGSLT